MWDRLLAARERAPRNGGKHYLACAGTWNDAQGEKKRLREVIVRSLPPTSSDDPETLERMRARLREEAHLATYLQHPRIACTLGPYEVQGVLYIVSDSTFAIFDRFPLGSPLGRGLGLPSGAPKMAKVESDRVEGTSINTLITYSQMREKLLSPAFCLYPK